MYPSVLIFLVGTMIISYEVLAADSLRFIGNVMVESNVTLDAQNLLEIFRNMTQLTLTDAIKVDLQNPELTADCVITGDKTSCNCSQGYVWSNEVCYSQECCRVATCTKNVSHIAPLCIAKTEVRINGSFLPGKVDNTQLTNAFEELNGFQSLNVTSNSGNFEAVVNVKFSTETLQRIVTKLETSTSAKIRVDTLGLVTIEYPKETVCYKSVAVLKCLFDEAVDTPGWNLSRKHERFELSDGTVVKLNPSCDKPADMLSCVEITLQGVTGIWSGTYECGFPNGSVRHTARAELKVALLPDVINLNIEPLIADCSQTPATVLIKGTAIIRNSTETFTVTGQLNDKPETKLKPPKREGDNLVYKFEANVSCEKPSEKHFYNVTFKNTMDQIKSAKVDIPTLYADESFCESDNDDDGVEWPRTPSGVTAINQRCPEGSEGYKSRTCEHKTWLEVFHYCVNQKLVNILADADNFEKGLGATREVALNIFEGLFNSSMSESETANSVANINASIGILSVMSNASRTVELNEEVLPKFVDAASNLVNKTWAGVNESVIHNMSSNYLASVEGLVKNIRINNTKELNSTNLDLKFCSNSSKECNVSVFGINVSMEMSSGIMKTVAVKNLMEKLRNDFRRTERTGLLLSATLTGNDSEDVKIKLAFPNDQRSPNERHCVFWNTTTKEWSDRGCTLKTSDVNTTVCECTHLTSFSVLMSKGDVSTPELDMITNVGLGVSVFSLLLLLIVESLVWSAVVKSNLSHFRHTALVNISVFILLADCSFLASSSPASIPEHWCLVLTVCKHLFFLAAFCWMMCLSVMLIHQLIFVFSPLRKRVFMFFASIVGYVCPVLIVGSSYVYCKYTETDYFNKETCWLVYKSVLEGSMHAFILPVGTVILTNLFAMLVVMLTLLKSSVPDQSKADDKETAKSILKVVVFLTPVFGVTWIIGFALLILKRGTTLFTGASYSFTILNSFQGLLIFITGCVAEQKVREEFLKIIMAKSKGKSESMKNLTSTTNTKDK